MACDLSPQCNFLYGFFKCQLPEDTIDVEITVRTLTGIHTFRKDCTIQSSICSLWCSQIRLFPSLLRKMEAYIEERRNTANPFSPTRRYPNRPSLSPFSTKTTTTKRSRTESKRGSKKHHNSRKVGLCFVPITAVMPTFSFLPAMVAMTPKVTTTATGISTQPPAVQHQPNFNQTQSPTATSAPDYVPPVAGYALIVTLPQTIQSGLTLIQKKEIRMG